MTNNIVCFCPFSLPVAAVLQLPVVVVRAVHHVAVQRPPVLCILCFYYWELFCLASCYLQAYKMQW